MLMLSIIFEIQFSPKALHQIQKQFTKGKMDQCFIMCVKCICVLALGEEGTEVTNCSVPVVLFSSL